MAWGALKLNQEDVGGGGQHLDLGEPVTVLLDGDELAHQVVLRLGAARGDEFQGYLDVALASRYTCVQLRRASV